MTPDRLLSWCLRRLLAGLAVACLLVQAAVPPAAAADGDFRAWLAALWPEAQQQGVSRATFEQAFAGLQPDLSLPDLAGIGSDKTQKSGQKEFLIPAGSYMSDKRIQALAAGGRKVAARHGEALAAIEDRYGVDRNILVAIFGRETDFGAENPKRSVIQVLATQAFAGRRKEYFRGELLAALRMLEAGEVTPGGFKGSWAGAFGLTQFMPSGFLENAVDFDGDGRRDVWGSVADALASTAVELTKAVDRDGTFVGWQRGLHWGWEVRKPDGFDCTLAGYDRPRPIRDWLGLGFRLSYDRKFRPAQLAVPAFLLLPEGAEGPAFLVTSNFLALKVYNYADLYALFVGHTADRMAGGRGFETPWAKDSHLTESAILDLQRRLVALGYDVGKVDGKIGWRMRLALGQLEKRQGLTVDCFPSDDDIAALQSVAVGEP